MTNFECTELVGFFKGATVFLTGVTGLFGKIYLEKLLRTCQVGRVYVLVRPKKGKDVSTRFTEIFEPPIFDKLKSEGLDFKRKVVMVSGDCNQPNLGLCEADVKTIINNTNIVINCAATVRFDQNLRTAANINVRSLMDLLKISRKMQKLKAFVHVSTAFANCVHWEIDEVFYDPPMKSSQLFKLLEALNDELLEKITPTLVGGYQNSYIFTKSIAEDVLKSEGHDLPVVLIRPSVVVASVKEPLPGWIDNFYGLTGMCVASCLGILHCMYGKEDIAVEIIPADYCINCSLVAAWAVSKTNNNSIPIYNMVSAPDNRITLRRVYSLTLKHAYNFKSVHQVAPGVLKIRSSTLAYQLTSIFLEIIPAQIADFVMVCLKKEPMFVKSHEKIAKFINLTRHFMTNEWKFTNENVKSLWQMLREKDREMFEFNVADLDWDKYWYDYVKGMRIYILKDPLETLPEGRRKYLKIVVGYYSFVTVLAVMFLLLVWYLIALFL